MDTVTPSSLLPCGRPQGNEQGRGCCTPESADTFEAGRDYWMNAVALATVARMVCEPKAVQAGVHYLSLAVDPVALMEERCRAGVQQTVSFAFAEQLLGALMKPNSVCCV